MAVLGFEQYRQKNGKDILKVILKSTQKFPDAYFYCDASDEELVKRHSWFLHNQRQPYVVADFRDFYSHQTKYFHQEKAFNILNYYPDYINHIDGIEYDNVNANLDIVSQQQNCWCKPTKGYAIDGRSFEPYVRVNSRQLYAKCVHTEVEVCQTAYQLELQYEDYRYNFLQDRRKDIDILDLERTGRISADEAIYRHVLRHAANNAWYYFRYNLTRYFADNHIPVPAFSIDDNGYMVHPITGQRLCPL